MKKLLILLLLVSQFAFARGKQQGWCQDGNTSVTIPGTQGSGTQKFQRSFSTCTVTVYLAGTTTIATIYSNMAGTVKGNPFTSATSGQWFFYVDDGNYDIKFSGGGIPGPFTLGDFSIGGAPTSFDCSKFSGADASIKANNCITAVQAFTTGGMTADLSLLGGQSQVISQTITVPLAVNLVFPTNSTWTCTITDGTPCISMAGHDSTITSAGVGGGAIIKAGPLSNISEVLFMGGANTPNISTHLRVDNLMFTGNSTATIANAVVNMNSVYDSSFRNVVVANCPSPCLWIHDLSAAVSPSDLDFFHLILDGGYYTGAIPLKIDNSFASFPNWVRFYGGTFGHPGSGQPIIKVVGNTVGSGWTGLLFDHIYYESSNTDKTTNRFQLTNVNSVVFDGGTLNNLVTVNTSYAFSISDTSGANITANISIKNFEVLSGAGSSSNLVINNIDSNYTVTGYTYLNDYEFQNFNRGDELLMLGPMYVSGKTLVFQNNTGGINFKTVAGTVPNVSLYRDNSDAIAIRNDQAGKEIVFVAGGTGAANIGARITPNGGDARFKVERGIDNSGAFKAQYDVIGTNSTCPTAAAVGATCSMRINWLVAFTDSLYTPVCTMGWTTGGVGSLTGVPVVVSAQPVAGYVIVTIAALTAVAANGDVSCIGVRP